MNLQAIWSRIDQLEQLILDQAREIDILRRSIAATQMTVEEINNQDCSNGYNHHGHGQGRNAICARDQVLDDRENALLAISNHHNDRHQTNQMTKQPLYRSSVMNPIHPANAIPPARRIVLTSTEFNHHHQEQTTFYHGQPNGLQRRIASERPMSQTLATMGGPCNNQRTLPANTRWSTGPSLLDTLTDYDGKGSSGAEQDTGKRRGIFNLVEIITCFCPCVNLC